MKSRRVENDLEKDGNSETFFRFSMDLPYPPSTRPSGQVIDLGKNIKKKYKNPLRCSLELYELEVHQRDFANFHFFSWWTALTTSPYSVREAAFSCPEVLNSPGQHARDYAGCPHLKEEGVHEA